MTDQLEIRAARGDPRTRAAQVPAAAAAASPGSTTTRARAGCARRWRSARWPAPAAGAVALPWWSRSGAGASNAFAGWSAKPDEPGARSAGRRAAACRQSQSPVAGLPLALADTRGPFTFAVVREQRRRPRRASRARRSRRSRRARPASAYGRARLGASCSRARTAASEAVRPYGFAYGRSGPA